MYKLFPTTVDAKSVFQENSNKAPKPTDEAMKFAYALFKAGIKVTDIMALKRYENQPMLLLNEIGRLVNAQIQDLNYNQLSKERTIL